MKYSKASGSGILNKHLLRRTPALETSLILSEILSFLPHSDLKATRLVNHLWFEESQKYFKTKGLIKLAINTLMNGSINVQDYLTACEIHQNILIDTDATAQNQSRHKLLFKVYSSLDQFTISYGHNIKNLQLSLKISDMLAFDFATKAIQNLHNLEELFLTIDIPSICKGVEEAWINIEPLYYLRKFKLVTSRVMRPFNLTQKMKREKMCENLVRLTPNIYHLSIWHNGLYLKEIIRQQSNCLNKTSFPFQNLNSLHFETGHEKWLGLCLSFLQPLSHLKIGKSFLLRGSNALELLQKVLHKNSKTLKSVSVSQTLCHYIPNGCSVQLPDMPELKTLSLDYYAYMDTMESRDLFRFNELIKMGGDKFKEKFPKLCFLELNLELEYGTARMDFFIPIRRKVDLCFKQITCLKMLFPYGEESRRTRRLIHLYKIFPNIEIQLFYPIYPKGENLCLCLF